jgi:hypothetical protein
MALITHVNVCNADHEIYCCLRNKVVKLDSQQQEQFCSGCKMFAGDEDGQMDGVTCVWEDVRDVNNPHYALDPLEEFIHNQKRQVPPDGTALFLYTS